MTLQQQAVFENIVGKGEIARNEQFLLFPQCFQFNQIVVYPFVHIFDIISILAAEMVKPKIGISVKGLIDSNTENFWKTLRKMEEKVFCPISTRNEILSFE